MSDKDILNAHRRSENQRSSKELSPAGKAELAKLLSRSYLTQAEIDDVVENATEQSVKDFKKLLQDTGFKGNFSVLEEGADKTESLGRRTSRKDKPAGRARYLMIQQVGEGGQGSVSVGYDLRMGRLIALKNVFAQNQRELDKVEKEAVLMAKFSGQANVLNVYDFRRIFDPDNKHSLNGAIVMEYMNPEYSFQLDRLGAEKQLLPPSELALLAKGLADALKYYHAKGIKHMDIKPSNIFRTDSGDYKLTDFGIATEEEKTGAGIMGSPGYMAPESLKQGSKLTPASEVYTVALNLLYGMSARNFFRTDLSGEPGLMDILRQTLKFEPKSTGSKPLMDVLFNYVKKQFPNNATKQSAMIKQLLPIFQKALAPEPSDRYQSVTELSSAIGKALR